VEFYTAGPFRMVKLRSHLKYLPALCIAYIKREAWLLNTCVFRCFFKKRYYFKFSRVGCSAIESLQESEFKTRDFGYDCVWYINIFGVWSSFLGGCTYSY